MSDRTRTSDDTLLACSKGLIHVRMRLNALAIGILQTFW